MRENASRYCILIKIQTRFVYQARNNLIESE